MTRISTLEHNVKRFVQQFCDKLLDNFLFYPFISAIFLKYVETDIGVLSTLHSSETPDPILFPSSSSPPLPPPSSFSSSPSSFVPPFFFLLPTLSIPLPLPLYLYPLFSFSFPFVAPLSPVYCAAAPCPTTLSSLFLINVLIHTSFSPPFPLLSHLLAFKPLSLVPERMQSA